MKERWTAENMPDLKGRIAIVTGANSGIGFAAARELAARNAGVVMACRDSGQGEEAARKIHGEYPGATLSVSQLDLGSLESVRAFSSKFLGGNSGLDLLINNAGIMMPPYGRTSDGFELQFGINHLGHFALTGLLLPLLLETKGSRVVTISSTMHRLVKINFENLDGSKGYRGWKAYGRSKLANLLFTYELQRRLDACGSGTIAVAAHPGWTSTNLQRYAWGLRFLNPVMGQGPPAGALPTLRAAADEGVNGGEYYGPGGFMELHETPVRVTSCSRSHDPETSLRLWEVSEELTGVRYRFTQGRAKEAGSHSAGNLTDQAIK